VLKGLASGKELSPISKKTLRVFFTALYEMQTRSSDENSVCPSVRLSVCSSVRPSVTRVIPDKMEERSVQIFIPYERTFILVF